MATLRTALPLAAFPANRAPLVGSLARLANGLFGSPVLLRANGFTESSLPAVVAARLRRRKRADVPVFQVDRRGFWDSERLPRIWVSERDHDVDGAPASRRRVSHAYPCGPDVNGSRALNLAERMFSEGMTSEGEEAIACFQAAELLYLHAVDRGSIEACTRLGALYRADLCHGSYWRDSLSAHAKHVSTDVAMKAVRMFSRAAARGNAEAKWQLGDMRAAGIGCTSDPGLAWNLYKGSFCRASGCTLDELEHACSTDEVLALVNGPNADMEACGCAAVRIAASLERGEGCSRNAEAACTWYTAAARLLDSCVDAGSWCYSAELASAECGAKRIESACASECEACAA